MKNVSWSRGVRCGMDPLAHAPGSVTEHANGAGPLEPRLSGSGPVSGAWNLLLAQRQRRIHPRGAQRGDERGEERRPA